MKMFVVLSGEYETRHVVGAFSTRAKAEALGLDEIEEFEVDAGADRRWAPLYMAQVRLADGSVIRRLNAGLHEIKDDWRGEANVWEMGGEVIARSPVSIDHALELAVERRQEWLRTRDLRPSSGSGGP